MSERPKFSAVIPVYNEEETLPVLHKRLTGVLSKLGMPYEIVLVNDGSRDRSEEIIRQLSEKDPHVVGILLARNYGHQICLTAGLDHARGDIVAMMDADLQDPPELLPRMIRKMNEGFDVVYAQRKKRAGESWFKLATAAFFYRLLRKLTNIDIPVDTGDFRIINRRALDSVLALREHNRFLRGMFSWVGFRQTGVLYNRAARHAGETKYPFHKMLKFALDGITSFSTVPLRLATQMGFVFGALAILYGLRVLWVWVMGGTVQGWASTILAVLVLSSAQLVTLGILGEYIGRIFDEVRGRPLYFVREVASREGESIEARVAARTRRN